MGDKPNLSVVTPSAAAGAAATQWWCPRCGTTAEKVSGSESCACLAHGSPVAMLEVLENQPLPSTSTPIGMETGKVSGPLGGFVPYPVSASNRLSSDEVMAEGRVRTLHKYTQKEGWTLSETTCEVSFRFYDPEAVQLAGSMLDEMHQEAFAQGEDEAARRNQVRNGEASITVEAGE